MVLEGPVEEAAASASQSAADEPAQVVAEVAEGTEAAYGIAFRASWADLSEDAPVSATAADQFT